MKFDVNQSARVVLTERGAQILNAERDRLASLYPLGYHSPIRSEGDIYKASIWSLMHDFGPFMVLGAMSPFQSIEVIPWRTAADDEADRMRAMKRRMYR